MLCARTGEIVFKPSGRLAAAAAPRRNSRRVRCAEGRWFGGLIGFIVQLLTIDLSPPRLRARQRAHTTNRCGTATAPNDELFRLARAQLLLDGPKPRQLIGIEPHLGTGGTDLLHRLVQPDAACNEQPDRHRGGAPEAALAMHVRAGAVVLLGEPAP